MRKKKSDYSQCLHIAIGKCGVYCSVNAKVKIAHEGHAIVHLDEVWWSVSIGR